MKLDQSTADQQQIEHVLRQVDQVEARHHLLGRAGFVAATAPFLRDLAKQLDLETTTEAWAWWKIATDWRAGAAKQMQEAADLAHWFHVNPFAITPGQRVGLLANMRRVQAQERLAGGSFDAASPDAVYDLVLLATGSEQAADKARGDAAENLIAKLADKG